MENQYQTIIFDLDGTLADTLQDVRSCINIALEEMNKPILTENLAKSAIGPGSDQFLETILPDGTDEDKEMFLGKFRSHYWNHCLDHTQLFPGMEKVINSLEKEKIAVATNKPRKATEKILEGLGVLDRFDCIMGPEDVNHVKPHPEMIVRVLERLNCTPSQTLFVGDTDKDMLAGRGAGVVLCGAMYGYGDSIALERQSPRHIIHEAIQLLDIVHNYK